MKNNPIYQFILIKLQIVIEVLRPIIYVRSVFNNLVANP
jgi:hypothetical protein